MKLLSVFLCIGFLLTTIPVSAKLSVEDFEQIRSIIKEEIADSEVDGSIFVVSWLRDITNLPVESRQKLATTWGQLKRPTNK